MIGDIPHFELLEFAIIVMGGFLIGTWLVFRLWENREAKVVGEKPE